MKKRYNKGITLIALVITIIVLLILAGISIATLTGENGILKKAGTAQVETKKAKYQEILELIGGEIRPNQIIEKLSTKEFMDVYEEKIQEEILKEDILKGATKERKNDTIIWVTTKEGWIYKITQEEVILLGSREENPNPPTLQEAGITFAYNPNDWTKGNVAVNITANAPKFFIQYAKGEPEKESSWQNYEANTGVVMTENGNVYARLINNLGETSEFATGEVTKIDRIAPTLRVTQGSVTKNSIVVNVSASDNESGIPTSGAYQYYINGVYKPEATGNSYTFTNLNPGTQYTIKVVIQDIAGNSAEQIITPTTAEPTIADYKGRRYLRYNNTSQR